MSNNKQSSIDWLVERFAKYYAIHQLQDEIEQAKAMHKLEIIDARNNGFMQSAEGWNGEYGLSDFSCLTEEIESEQYYKETFGDNK